MADDALFNVALEGDQTLRITMRQQAESVRAGFERGIKRATIKLESFYKTDILSGQVVKSHSRNLSRSTHHDFPERFTGVVSWGKEAPYAVYVNDGTRAHIIAPKNGKALAFTPGADRIRQSAFARTAGIRKTLEANKIVVRVVHHPGTAPTNFAEIGLKMFESNIREIIADDLAHARGNASVRSER